MWNSLGTGWRYTVEWAADLRTDPWRPVTGTSWPILRTDWADSTAGLGNSAVFYRVMAEPTAP